MSSARSSSRSDQNAFKKPATLGSKARSFIPMTPRSLKTNAEHRNDFARQVAEQTGRGQDGQPPHKKFRSSAAPKGTRLGSGYVDRAQQRVQEQDEGAEDKQKRLKALEEMLKLQQIDAATFEELRSEIGIDGDLNTTHLIKGLDFKLLERARRGEDISKAVNAEEEEEEEEEEPAPSGVDVDDELEKALDRESGSQDTTTKREGVAEDVDDTPSAEVDIPAASLSRDELLRRLRQNRKNPSLLSSDTTSALAPVQPESQSTLDHSKFRKLESVPKSNKRKFTETINGRRREVLVITDKEGKTKRKTRWLDPEPDPAMQSKEDPNKEAWGGDLPAEVLARQKAAAGNTAKDNEDDDDDDDDIFGGVKEYDPLLGIDSDDEETTKPNAALKVEESKESGEDAPEGVSKAGVPLKSTSTLQPRNYFTTTSTTTTEDTEVSKSKDITHDPAILAALKRAAQIRRQEEEEEGNGDAEPSQTPEEKARNHSLLKKLQDQSWQDDLDIDMGFGGDTKYDDDDEGEDGKKQKLSEWTGGREDNEDDNESGKKSGGGANRKRDGKKKKGDKNSFKDVMSVLERREPKT
ncbi:hypothetical protein H2198_001966 [Neophaeococcomyces mojaviensis]|uniref:Uncharacterized protein n=1 Tax=Neophaeococcomyces mojaviensis TaxID=3383035 RepID=A0ACC3AFE7_9EURO|nr:hypothetical protein H2198_001966 [Knufia sp. JES_112]